MTNETLEPLGQAIVGALPGAVGGYTLSRGELTPEPGSAAVKLKSCSMRDGVRTARDTPAQSI